MKYVSILALLVLTGCATVGTIQAKCEAANNSFASTVSCLDRKVKQDNRLAANQGVKLYMLRAHQLSEQVYRGLISELDAKFELQRLYVQLKDKEDASLDAFIRQSQQNNRTLRTTCSTIGGITNCTTR